MRGSRAASLLVAIGVGCAGAPRPTGRGDEQDYLEVAAVRRETLESSLTNPSNLYSRLRLESYGLRERGWDALPEWNPRSVPLDAELERRFASGEAPELPRAPLWDGQTPRTEEEWVALGRRVFFGYPMRAEALLEHALGDEALRARVGLGDVGMTGAVWFKDVDGRARVGISCALCHANVEGGRLVEGRARRALDFGRLRVEVITALAEPLAPRDAERMMGWGPGRADVTEDDDLDPVAIPDLWGLAAQRYLTQAGTLTQVSPITLAIRQETQLIDSNHQRVRPPRVLVWALVRYLYALAPPPTAAKRSPRGQALFRKLCAECHSNAAYGGGLVRVEEIGTDPALARGRGRGTGRVRVASLLGVASGAPYLHDGSVATLEALLSKDRSAPGHWAGTELSPEDRAALIDHLDGL